MGAPERNMGLTTTCNVGVDLDTIMILFQSSVTTFGGLLDCAKATELAQSSRIYAPRKRRYGVIKAFLRSDSRELRRRSSPLQPVEPHPSYIKKAIEQQFPIGYSASFGALYPRDLRVYVRTQPRRSLSHSRAP